MLMLLTTSRQNYHGTIGQYLHKSGVRDAASLAEFPPIVICDLEWGEKSVPYTAADNPGKAGGHAAQRNSFDRSERSVPMRTCTLVPIVTTQSVQFLASDSD